MSQLLCQKQNQPRNPVWGALTDFSERLAGSLTPIFIDGIDGILGDRRCAKHVQAAERWGHERERQATAAGCPSHFFEDPLLNANYVAALDHLP